MSTTPRVGWIRGADGNWYPPPAPRAPQFQAPPTVVYQRAKNSHGCLWAFLIVLGVVVLAAGGLIVSASVQRGNDEKAAAKTCAGLSYPDQQKLDRCADVNGQVMNFGFTVTVANIGRTGEDVFGPAICADVSYLNRADGASSYNVFDWKLQTPSGVVQSFELTEATLHSGDVVSGGTVSGSVCFKDRGESGQFVLIWKPELRSDRGIWVVDL